MMIAGRIWKDGSWWLAESQIADVMTQGKTRTEAAAMLADAVESLVDRRGFRVTVRDAPSAGDGGVMLDASDPAALIALVLRRQRQVSGLSLADVADKLGQASKTAYARYEQGDVMPSMEKFEELLHAVSPRAAVVISTQAAPKARTKTR
jgi:hypothetical protein